jgi:hypothetical protein
VRVEDEERKCRRLFKSASCPTVGLLDRSLCPQFYWGLGSFVPGVEVSCGPLEARVYIGSA